MKSKITHLIIGILFLAAGILYGGNAIGIWDYSLFFDGWWTLFIIVPSICMIATSGISFFPVSALSVGILLLLDRQDKIGDLNVGKSIFALILLYIGLSLIFSKFKISIPRNKNKFSKEKSDIIAILSGNSPKFSGVEVKGTLSAIAVLGGIDLDLRKAIINEDLYIDTVTVLGGMDIYLPDNVGLVVDCLPILGGVDSTFRESTDEGKPIVYLSGQCVLGGIDIS